MCPPRCAVYTHVASSFSFTHSQLKSTTHLFIPQFIPILCKFGHRLACILYHVPNCWWLVWMFKFVSFVLMLLSPPSLQLVCLSEWTFDVLYFRHSHSLRSLLDVWGGKWQTWGINKNLTRDEVPVSRDLEHWMAEFLRLLSLVVTGRHIQWLTRTIAIGWDEQVLYRCALWPIWASFKPYIHIYDSFLQWWYSEEEREREKKYE